MLCTSVRRLSTCLHPKDQPSACRPSLTLTPSFQGSEDKGLQKCLQTSVNMACTPVITATAGISWLTKRLSESVACQEQVRVQERGR